MSIVIKNVKVGKKALDILIDGNRIADVSKNISSRAEFRVDGKGFAAIPGFVNGHTHAAMSLLRGYADDMELDEWLTKKIWPLEEKMSEKDVYIGSRLACIEMIKSGTTFFNDMYWHWHGTAKAAEETGIRAAISPVFIDFSEEMANKAKALNKRLLAEANRYSERVSFSLGPHSIYTVSEESLIWLKEFSEKNSLLMHFHLSETEKEVKECIKKHNMRPVEYLEKIGFLGNKLVACHSVWLNNNEIRLLKKHDVAVVYNPVSNMKLSVGNAFNYPKIKGAGIRAALGTDGCASNNSLNMLEEMKFASLIQKHQTKSPVVANCSEIFDLATTAGASVFGLDYGIRKGALADLSLVSLKEVSLVPGHNLISDLVYSASPLCIDTVICDGKIVMHERKIKNEEKIKEEAIEAAKSLVAKAE